MADNAPCTAKTPEPNSIAGEESEEFPNGNSLVDIETCEKPKKGIDAISITKKQTTTTITTIATVALATTTTTTTSTPIVDDSSNDISFRKWAMAEREKRNQVLQQVSYQQSKQEREQNEIFPKIKTTTQRNFDSDKECNKTNKKKVSTFHSGNQLLSGYLYGGFGELCFYVFMRSLLIFVCFVIN